MTQVVTEPRLITVTPRQRAAVGELARDGADNPTIALRLGITHHTVKSHVKHVIAAVGADNRTHLVVLLLRGHVRLRVENNSGIHLRSKEPA